MKLVFPSINVWKACWIFNSVLVSIEEVASSRMSIDGLLSMTLAMDKSCRCPCEKSSPCRWRGVSNPCGSFSIILSNWHWINTCWISSSVAFGFPNNKFSRMVPDCNHVSCNTIPNNCLNCCLLMSFMDMPSIVIFPLSTS